MEDTVALLGALLALLTGIGALIQARATERKSAEEAKTTAHKVDVDALCVTLDQLRLDNGRLQKRLDAVEAENAELRKQIAGYEAEIARLQCELEKLQAGRRGKGQ